MLRDAALLTLELTEQALDHDLILKDATPFNVQFVGARPTFIDIGSFERFTPGEPWFGYRQFCEQFLNPLLVQAQGIPSAAWTRGSLRGITPGEASAALPFSTRVRPSVFVHVGLHAWAERRYAASNRDVRSEMRNAGLSGTVIRGQVRRLRKVVERLKWKPRGSAWSEYTDRTHYTEADLAADRIIAEGLAQVAPDIPSLSEERATEAMLPYKESFFLIDPLDGTKEFVAGRNEFTVNLALVTHGTPLLGIVSAPALGLVWRGIVGRGAERLTLGNGKPLIEPIRTRPCPPRGQPWTVAVSRSHGDARTEAFIAARPGAVRCELGSAVKFGRVAEGTVDIYPRLSPTSEWDVAAGHAVVTAAGGRITDSSGAELVFGAGRSDFIVPEFIAWGDPKAAD
jgi:3'(2'), 5'-bisphosphate nucleotidase